jgi:hydroxymethylpyrimidine/phosphomethylpyrimidine kinase
MLCRELLPLAYVVTPNIPEAEALSGCRILSKEDAEEAARRIHDLGATAVIITGGHQPDTDHVSDLLFDGQRFSTFRTARIDTSNTHGTGCTFAAAVAAHLALGQNLASAAERSQQYVAGAIQHALAIGHGHGPLNHFWKQRI